MYVFIVLTNAYNLLLYSSVCVNLPSFCLLESGPESGHTWPAGGDHVLLSDSDPAGSQSKAEPCAHPARLTDQESQPGDPNLYRREVQLIRQPL